MLETVSPGVAGLSVFMKQICTCICNNTVVFLLEHTTTHANRQNKFKTTRNKKTNFNMCTREDKPKEKEKPKAAGMEGQNGQRGKWCADVRGAAKASQQRAGITIGGEGK
jgi:hypothetical protein